MLPKPAGCIACPLYGDGQGFVPDEDIEGAVVKILGQNPGEDEEREGRPFVGATGQKMEREYFPLAGLERGKVSIGNVLRCRDAHRNDLPSGARLADAIEHCSRAYLRIPQSTRLVVAQGHLAWGVFSTTKITDWRGFMAPGHHPPVYGVQHLSDRHKDHAAAFAARKDWFKIRSVLAGRWPCAVPPRLILTTDDQWDVAEHLLARAAQAPGVAIDTEFTPDGKMTVLGIGWNVPKSNTSRSVTEGLQIQWMAARVSPWVRGKLCDWIRTLAHEQRCVFHNAVADLPVLRDNMGVPVESYQRIEDTMLAHSVLWSELPHDLAFLASLYGQYHKLKHLGDRRVPVEHRLQWARGIEGTLCHAQHVARTPKSGVSLPLRSTLAALQNKEEAAPSAALHQRDGGSTWTTTTRLAPCVDSSAIPATSHWDGRETTPVDWPPSLAISDGAALELDYNWGDVLTTLDVWDALDDELANDRGSTGVYRSQLLPLIPTLIESHEAGILVNAPRVVAAEAEYTRILSECTARSAAFMGFPFNLGSEQQLKRYFYVEREFPLQKDPHTHKPSSADAAVSALRQAIGPEFAPEEEACRGGLTLEEAIARIEEGGDPVLELRTVYAGALQSLSHYIQPCRATPDGRIYPRLATHPQADGRWSITNPPLAQLPYALRDIIIPDPGWCWIGFDWSNIEPRFKCAYTGSDYLRRVFDNGWDLHTLNFCAAFNRPQPPVLDAKRLHTCLENLGWRQLVDWRGKDDIRRVFCKRLQYKMDYGGMPETAFHIPGAAQLGLTRKKLVDCAYAILNADPVALAWRRRVVAEAQRTRRVYTFTGRVRRLLGADLRAIAREAINFPMQAGVSDIFNLTVVEVKRVLPWLRFAWQMHDSQYWACPTERVEETVGPLKAIAERPFMIEGRAVSFPADFKLIYNGNAL